MTAPTSNRVRRFSLPDLGDERADEAIAAFLSGPEDRRDQAGNTPMPGSPARLDARPSTVEGIRQRRVHPLAIFAKHDLWKEALRRESVRSLRYGRPAAVLIVAGLPTAETVEARAWLGRVSAPIAHAVRRGIRGADLATRTAEATFQVLLPETTDQEAKHAAERMMADCEVWLRAIDAPVVLRWAAVGTIPGIPLEIALARAREEIEGVNWG